MNHPGRASTLGMHLWVDGAYGLYRACLRTVLVDYIVYAFSVDWASSSCMPNHPFEHWPADAVAHDAQYIKTAPLEDAFLDHDRPYEAVLAKISSILSTTTRSPPELLLQTSRPSPIQSISELSARSLLLTIRPRRDVRVAE